MDATLFKKMTNPSPGDRSVAKETASEQVRPGPDESSLPVVPPPPLTEIRWQKLSLTPTGLIVAPDDRLTPRAPVILRDEPIPPAFGHVFATLERLTAGLAVIGVTSAVQGEGKSTVALHVARAAAESSYKRVCLIDLSLGEDELCRRIGAAPAPGGVVRFLEADRPLTVLQWPGPFHLSFFAAGKAPVNAARTARSPRIPDLINALRDQYDLIIVDLPAVSTDNVAPLARHLDGLIFVARAGATPRRVINSAMDTVGRENVVGFVLNQATRVASGSDRTNGSTR